jgi:hypothetical protein
MSASAATALFGADRQDDEESVVDLTGPESDDDTNDADDDRTAREVDAAAAHRSSLAVTPRVALVCAAADAATTSIASLTERRAAASSSMLAPVAAAVASSPIHPMSVNPALPRSAGALQNGNGRPSVDPVIVASSTSSAHALAAAAGPLSQPLITPAAASSGAAVAAAGPSTAITSTTKPPSAGATMSPADDATARDHIYAAMLRTLNAFEQAVNPCVLAGFRESRPSWHGRWKPVGLWRLRDKILTKAYADPTDLSFDLNCIFDRFNDVRQGAVQRNMADALFSLLYAQWHIEHCGRTDDRAAMLERRLQQVKLLEARYIADQTARGIPLPRTN